MPPGCKGLLSTAYTTSMADIRHPPTHPPNPLTSMLFRARPYSRRKSSSSTPRLPSSSCGASLLPSLLLPYRCALAAAADTKRNAGHGVVRTQQLIAGLHQHRHPCTLQAGCMDIAAQRSLLGNPSPQPCPSPGGWRDGCSCRKDATMTSSV